MKGFKINLKYISNLPESIKYFIRPIYKLYKQVKSNIINYILIKIGGFSHQVIEFGFFEPTDNHDLKWSWWSRTYEYPWILKTIQNLSTEEDVKIHNTCWGHSEIHKEFKDEIEKISTNVTNSDLINSYLNNTEIYDVTKPAAKKWINFFDFVINVSTLEEIQNSQVKVYKNLLAMVKPGGYLLMTFDYPGLQMNYFTKLFGEPKIPINALNGDNSSYPMKNFRKLNCGYLAVRRIS